MSVSLALECKPVALELHQLLLDIDPARLAEAMQQDMIERIRSLESRLVGLLRRHAPAAFGEDLQRGQGVASRVESRTSSDRLASGLRSERAAAVAGTAGSGKMDTLVIADSLRQIADLLKNTVPQSALPAAEAPSRWQRVRKQLGSAYEALSKQLASEQVTLPQLRPQNHARSITHVLMGSGSLLLVEYVLSDAQRIWIPGAVCLWAWTMEISRRRSTRVNALLMRVFRAIAHPREAMHVNSSTWYTTALTVLGIAFAKPLCAIAVAVLALADPAAAYVGRAYGRTKLVHGRSLEGTLTFFAVAALTSFAVLSFWHGNWDVSLRIAVSLTAAFGAALAELFSRKIDDNLSIPLVAAGCGWLALLLFG